MIPKGIRSLDRFHNVWKKIKDLGINQWRGRFLNFSETPPDFNFEKFEIYCGKY